MAGGVYQGGGPADGVTGPGKHASFRRSLSGSVRGVSVLRTRGPSGWIPKGKMRRCDAADTLRAWMQVAGEAAPPAGCVLTAVRKSMADRRSARCGSDMAGGVYQGGGPADGVTGPGKHASFRRSLSGSVRGGSVLRTRGLSGLRFKLHNNP